MIEHDGQSSGVRLLYVKSIKNVSIQYRTQYGKQVLSTENHTYAIAWVQYVHMMHLSMYVFAIVVFTSLTALKLLHYVAYNVYVWCFVSFAPKYCIIITMDAYNHITAGIERCKAILQTYYQNCNGY